MEDLDTAAKAGGAEEWPMGAGRAADLLMVAGRFEDLIGPAGNADSPITQRPSLFPRTPEALRRRRG